MLDRRNFIRAMGLAAAATVSLPLRAAEKPTVFKYQDSAARRAIEALEKSTGGRLGVALTRKNGEIDFAYRGDERFAMCSTFKLPLAWAVLEAGQKGLLDLKAPIALTENDLVPYAPFVEERLRDGGETNLHELIEAAVITSDNAAANLALEAIGGPEALTRYFRSQGDTITRLDRIEPDLNENRIGDVRDTTSPAAFSQLIHEIMIKNPCCSSKTIVYEWMARSQTGLARIRLGIPYGWPVGNKTGTAPDGLAYNDVAIFWPSFAGYDGDDPRILSIFMDRPTAPAAEVERRIAEVAKIAAWIAARKYDT
ncbi:class A beta-lactamase [Parasphingorhabdus halotolerans]|uniref:beta-lactamase n=1 Tax=Parasphingorhabdus halotolerans TaxID=2725558 RepID=A0A6H2DKZ5_9SPHN|nr:class A beta-lactamase [Parasphingorhabdus halotolerans]QJB68421.1 class A beta-lactamase [Parasphingorhabdus halotolerans]